jgi:hypothetical protein
MTAFTVPSRRRSLFGAFRGGVEEQVASTDASVPTVIESQSEIAPVPAADSHEPAIEAAETAVSAGTADDLGGEQRPAEPTRASADPARTSAEPARGGVFAGTKAQIRLTPSKASTHPISGRRGDLFVDSAGRLWFCRSGGKNATWKQVKLV